MATDGFAVQLRDVDADALLACAEAALNARLDFGPGLHAHNVEEAARRIEAVAELSRRGVVAPEASAVVALRAIADKCEAQGQTVLAAEIAGICRGVLG